MAQWDIIAIFKALWIKRFWIIHHSNLFAYPLTTVASIRCIVVCTFRPLYYRSTWSVILSHYEHFHGKGEFMGPSMPLLWEIRGKYFSLSCTKWVRNSFEIQRIFGKVFSFEKSKNRKNFQKECSNCYFWRKKWEKNLDFLIILGLIVHSNDETVYWEYNHSCLSLMLL